MPGIQPFPFPMSGGMDTSIVPMRADQKTFLQLLNIRQNPIRSSELQQTPPFQLDQQIPQGTFWDVSGGGSTTEGASSSVYALVAPAPTTSSTPSYGNYIAITQYTVQAQNRVTSGQLKVYYQIPGQANTSLQTNCKIVINSLSGLNLSLGNTLDIVIDAATTFKWRKNGGAFTTGVAISTAGVSIDSGNVTVYFLASTGFTIGVNWSWRRTDSSQVSGSASNGYIPSFVNYKNTTIFVSVSGRVMVIQTAALDAGPPWYVISVGYFPVYGQSLEIFYDHLFVGGYTTTIAETGLNQTSSSGVIANSDLTDLDCFFSTLVNEVDFFTIPVNTKLNSAVNTIVSVKQIQTQLWVFTNQEFWVTSYLGLPTVVSYSKYKELPGINRAFTSPGGLSSLYGNYLVGGVYIYTLNNSMYFFDGSNLTEIGNPVQALFSSYGFAPGTIFDATFQSVDREQIFLNGNQGLLVVYNEDLKTYYTRSSPLGPGATNCVSVVNGVLYVGGISRKVLSEDIAAAGTPVTGGSSSPVIITQGIMGNSLTDAKEISGVYLGVFLVTGAGGNYDSGANVNVQVDYVSSDSGIYTPASTFVTGGVYNATVQNNFVPLPRVSFRCIGLRLTLVGVNSKPVAGASITAIEASIYGLDPEITQK